MNNFTELNVQGKVEVELSEGKSGEIVVYYEGIDPENIITKAKGKTLEILVDVENNTEYEVKIDVPFEYLHKISAGAGAYIDVQDRIKGDKLNLNATSGAEIHCEVQVQKLELEASEGGGLFLSGTATNQDAKATSGADLIAYNLESRFTSAQIKNGAYAEVWAQERLEATVAIGGKLNYKGRPQAMDAKTSLGGNIAPL